MWFRIAKRERTKNERKRKEKISNIEDRSKKKERSNVTIKRFNAEGVGKGHAERDGA